MACQHVTSGKRVGSNGGLGAVGVRGKPGVGAEAEGEQEAEAEGEMGGVPLTGKQSMILGFTWLDKHNLEIDFCA